MVSVDELEYMTTNYNESVIALWPYKYLAAQEDEVEQLRVGEVIPPFDSAW